MVGNKKKLEYNKSLTDSELWPMTIVTEILGVNMKVEANCNKSTYFIKVNDVEYSHITMSPYSDDQEEDADAINFKGGILINN